MLGRGLARRECVPDDVHGEELDAALGQRGREQIGQFAMFVVAHSAVGTFLVDHDMELVLSACDYIYVLEFGKLIAEGTPAEIRKNPRVITAYLGAHAAEQVNEVNAAEAAEAADPAGNAAAGAAG